MLQKGFRDDGDDVWQCQRCPNRFWSKSNANNQSVRRAEKFPGPSLIIAYTPCITHGLFRGMKESIKEAKEAVSSGYWSLYRYNPELIEKNKVPMTLDYKKPDFSTMPDFMRKQVRFSSLENAHPQLAEKLFEKTVHDAKTRFYNYASLAGQLDKIKAKIEPAEEKETIEKPVREKRRKKSDPEAKQEERQEEQNVPHVENSIPLMSRFREIDLSIFINDKFDGKMEFKS